MTEEKSDSADQPSTTDGKIVEIKTTKTTTQTTTNQTPASQTTVTETNTTHTTTQTAAAPKPAPSQPTQTIQHITPMMGVGLAWALTGGFTKLSAVPKDQTDSPEQGGSSQSLVDKKSIQTNTSKAETILGDFLLLAGARETAPEVKEDLLESITAIQMSVRNLGTIYSGRELNFQQNDKFRKAYLDSITEDIKFGDNIRDYVKTLPNMIVAGGGGLGISLLAKSYLGFTANTLDILLIAIIFAVLGFFGSWIIRKWSVQKKIRQFMWQDHERNIYYEQYLNRASIELTNLYRVLLNIQKKRTAEKNTELSVAEETEVKKLLASLYPTSCKGVDTCIYHWLYDPLIWTQCETCGNSTQMNYPKSRDPEECPDKPRGRPLRFLANHGITWISIILILACCIVLAIAWFSIFAGHLPSASTYFTKSVNSSQIFVTKTAIVLVTFENKGPDRISNLTITDKSPDGFTTIPENITLSIPSLKSGESRSVQYEITPGNTGKYILDPAKAQFTDSSGTVITIESTSPEIQVLSALPESNPDLAPYNTSEFYSSMGKITSSFLPNATG